MSFGIKDGQKYCGCDRPTCVGPAQICGKALDKTGANNPSGWCKDCREKHLPFWPRG